ncbi:MAG: RsmB/NOP family class I SAM-dependent RNA methyltransferase [Nanobdellota archaeon]
MSYLFDRYSSLSKDKLSEESFSKPRSCLRVNTLKTTDKELVSSLQRKGVVLEKAEGVSSAWFFKAPFSLASTIEFLSGLFYIQGFASMLPAVVLLDDTYENVPVLDMCSAPGSKATQLAQLTSDNVPIVACDLDGARLRALHSSINRLGLSSIVTFRKDARFVSDLGMSFDRVLLDAPCSGNVCSEEYVLDSRSPLDFKDRSRLQKSLLHSAYDVLKLGGVLVYSTCSLEPEEDELVVDWFLQEYDDMSLVDTGLSIGDPGLTTVFDQELDSQLSKTRRFWPHKTGTEGFFIAKFVKK